MEKVITYRFYIGGGVDYVNLNKIFVKIFKLHEEELYIMKKIYTIIIVFICIINQFYNPILKAQANENDIFIRNIYIDFNCKKDLQDIETISIKKCVVIDNIENNLYPTFNNKDNALCNIKKDTKQVLDIIKEQNSLSELNDNNWEVYSNLVFQYDNDTYKEQIAKLKSFFDIYENDQSNINILQVLDKNNYNEIREELYYLLPYNTPFVEQQANLYNNMEVYSNFNVDAAISYARAYAIHPNVPRYAEFGSDCTNFASQIMENAGISQDNSVEWTWRGWWHTKDGNAHYHSNSWTVADNFARYMGVLFSTPSHYFFTSNLQKGDFILLDMDSDGDWNHVGFVISVDDYLTNGYYDYFVAQHSANYLEWASTSSNNWDLAESEGNSYGVIRK